MQPLSKKQLVVVAALYLTAAIGGSVFLARRGSPELVPSALVAQAFFAVALFAWFRVEESKWRPFLWPGLLLAAGCVFAPTYFARSAPYAMTPSFLAPELHITQMVDSLDTRLQTKMRLTATVQWWDPYPFSKGLTEPIKVRVFNETGSMDVIVDRAELETDLQEGQRIRMVGRIRKWEGQVIRFVALSLEFVEPEPAS